MYALLDFQTFIENIKNWYKALLILDINSIIPSTTKLQT